MSKPRHCSKGMQPVPKTVYCSCHHKHNCLGWDSNLGSHWNQACYHQITATFKDKDPKIGPEVTLATTTRK